MIFLPKNIPTSWLWNSKADGGGLTAPSLLEVLGAARQARVDSRRVVREPRRPLQWAAGICRGFYQLSDELQNAGRCPLVAR